MDKSRHAQGMKQSRTHLGPKFSEGARLLWEAKVSQQLSIEELRRRIKASSGMVNLWLYGDKRPGLTYAHRLYVEFGIAVTLWTQKPTATLVLPVSQEAST